MLIGAMNNPMIDITEELAMIADLGFDFIDLTLEPEQTYSAEIDTVAIKGLLQKYGLKAVGHTAWYLPIASPYPELREFAVNELKRCVRVLNEIEVDKMNVHPNIKAPLHKEDWVIAHNVDALAQLVDYGNSMGVKIMLENMPGFSRTSQIKSILDAVPGAYLLLDVGHANLDTPYNRAEELLSNFGDRLAHVHVSDNRGGHDDMHLPLGVGNINWLRFVRLLKNVNYDSTITVEVFGDDDDYLLISKDKIRYLWEHTQPGEDVQTEDEAVTG